MDENCSAGMTVNERLYDAGLLDSFDDAIHRRDRDRAVWLLRSVGFTESEAESTYRGNLVLQPIEQIYVYMPDEAVDVWRPVLARRLSDDTFEILSLVPDDEQWQFQPGDVVRCRMRRFSNGTGMTAYELVN